MRNLFESPIKEKKVRNGVYAYQNKNGTIDIDGIRYVFYSMSEAIQVHRKKYPAYKKRK